MYGGRRRRGREDETEEGKREATQKGVYACVRHLLQLHDKGVLHSLSPLSHLPHPLYTLSLPSPLSLSLSVSSISLSLSVSSISLSLAIPSLYFPPSLSVRLFHLPLSRYTLSLPSPLSLSLSVSSISLSLAIPSLYLPPPLSLCPSLPSPSLSLYPLSTFPPLSLSVRLFHLDLPLSRYTLSLPSPLSLSLSVSSISLSLAISSLYSLYLPLPLPLISTRSQSCSALSRPARENYGMLWTSNTPASLMVHCTMIIIIMLL